MIATAPGFGLGISLKDQPIRLRAGDLPINGRLVDLEGRPVPRVTVRLGQVSLPLPGGPPAGPESREPGIALDAVPALPDGVVTDADGRFRIAGLGRDVLADLTLSGPTIALKRVRSYTSRSSRVSARAARPRGAQGLNDRATHGAHCTIAVEPTRPIEGFVRDADTNEPIPGAVVTAASALGLDAYRSTG